MGKDLKFTINTWRRSQTNNTFTLIQQTKCHTLTRAFVVWLRAMKNHNVDRITIDVGER